VRDVEGAAEAVDGEVVATSEPGDDDRSAASDGRPGLAHAPHGLATATDAQAVSALPILAPPGACRYLQLDGVRQASCHALDPAIRLAPRQVELVCLGAGHTDCPRFTRAGGEAPVPATSAESLQPVHDLDPALGPATAGDALAATGFPQIATELPPAAPVEAPSVRLGHTVGSLQLTPQAHRSRWPRPAMVVATGVLAAAIVFAVGFAALRGGLDRSVGQAPAASVSVTASPAQLGSVGPTSSASAGPIASPSAGVAAASATPPVPSPRTSPSGAPSPDRMALLTPCPDQPECYQYRIHRHDNLRGIAAFFGVPYQTILDLNPQIKNPSLIRVGQIIILPPPGP
jgi:hypothetical protein